MDVSLKVDPEESTIYKNLKPGCFLFEYRKALNDAAYELAVENPQLVQKRENCRHWQRRKLIVMVICTREKSPRQPIYLLTSHLLCPEKREKLPSFLHGSKSAKQDLKKGDPVFYQYCEEVWQVRNDHQVKGLPEQYVFFLYACYKPNCIKKKKKKGTYASKVVR